MKIYPINSNVSQQVLINKKNGSVTSFKSNNRFMGQALVSKIKNNSSVLKKISLLSTLAYFASVLSINTINKSDAETNIKEVMFDRACGYKSLGGVDIIPQEIVEISDAVEYFNSSDKLSTMLTFNKDYERRKDWILHYTNYNTQNGVSLSKEEKASIKKAVDNEMDCPHVQKANSFWNTNPQTNNKFNNVFLKNYFLKGRYY